MPESGAQALIPQRAVDSFISEERLRGFSPAFQELERRLADAPERIWLECSELLMRRDFAGPASRLLRAGLKTYPQSVELIYLLANAERLMGNGSAALTLLHEILRVHPHHEKATLTLALLHRDRGQMDAAARLIRDLHRRHPGGENTCYLVNFLSECRRTTDAYEICEAAIAAGSSSCQLSLLAGAHATSLGLYDVARTHLLDALKGPEPEWGAALPLSLCQRYRSAAHPDFRRFRLLLENPELDELAKSTPGFALGKALDDIGDYAEAALVFRNANQRVSRSVDWRAETWSDFVALQVEKRFSPIASPVGHDLVPVFIVGLPRTGTTLTAELLSRHPEVRSRGELNWISFIAQHLQRADASKNPERLLASARLYIAHLRQDDAPARWYIDKNPLNFRHLGLIAALFPNARIIQCVRDRRDTALSIWSQQFDHEDNGYAYDFKNITAFAHGHDRLMDHARQLLQLPIHKVSYEALVSDPGKVIAEAFRFLGIENFDAMAMPARSGQAISTASVWQARQPIYQRSVQRWRSYASWLPELIEQVPEKTAT